MLLSLLHRVDHFLGAKASAYEGYKHFEAHTDVAPIISEGISAVNKEIWDGMGRLHSSFFCNSSDARLSKKKREIIQWFVISKIFKTTYPDGEAEVERVKSFFRSDVLPQMDNDCREMVESLRRNLPVKIQETLNLLKGKVGYTDHAQWFLSLVDARLGAIIAESFQIHEISFKNFINELPINI